MSLNNVVAVQSSFFVKIEQLNGTLLFSDHKEAVVIAGDTYTPLGKLVTVSPSNSDLRTSFQNFGIAVSGIPDSSIQAILTTKVKGSPVTVRRALFNPSTDAVIGTPIIKFKGFVNNYSLAEEYDIVNLTASNIIQYDCNSFIDVLSNKRAGRKTNPASMRRFYPADASFNRVPILVNTAFDFGKTRTTGDAQ
jgi:hypothetical protein